MATLTTKAIRRNLRASQLEADAQNHAATIGALDGNVPAEVDSIRETVMRYRADVWRRQPSLFIPQKDVREDTIPTQQLPSPISSASGSQQAVDSTLSDREIFEPVDKLVNGKENEMVQKMLKDLTAKRKAADRSQK